MSAASRRKGLTGEREVQQAFADRGYEMRGLEGSGDWLAFLPATFEARLTPYTYHVEAKRQERLRIPEWIEQAKREAPPGVPWILCFRQNRTEWIAALRLADLLDAIA